MNLKKSPISDSAKARTGIEGFDEITVGGLPRGRTTLLSGGPGSGKTIFALQFLVRGACDFNEPGIFVAFEETVERLATNAHGFGWELVELQRRNKLCLIDAQPTPDLIQSGTFDLGGLLASLGAQIKAMGARRIVFDALDIFLTLLPDAGSKRQEVYRLHRWLLDNKVTALITSKSGGEEGNSFTFMQFMVDCAVTLNHRVELGVSQRNLRVQKFRGSSFTNNGINVNVDAHILEELATPRPMYLWAP